MYNIYIYNIHVCVYIYTWMHYHADVSHPNLFYSSSAQYLSICRSTCLSMIYEKRSRVNEQALACLSTRDCRREQRVYISSQNGE